MKGTINMKTHKFDTVSFLSGLVISAIGLIYLLTNNPGDIWNALTNVGSWFWPVVLVAVALAVLLPVIIPRKSEEESSEEAA